MSFVAPACPICQTALTKTAEGDFDSWVCPQGHGLAATLSEGYERMQEDELVELWQLARAAAPASSGHACPICSKGMVLVDVPWDRDEAPEGSEGDGEAEGSVELDVCLDDQLLWFDVGELTRFPADLPDPEPSEEQLAAVAGIRAAFGQAVVDAHAEREAARLTEKIYRRIARHPGLARALTEVGSLGRR